MAKKILTLILAWAFVSPLPISFASNFLDVGSSILANPIINETSSHYLSFSTVTDLATGDLIELEFPQFELNFADDDDCQSSITITGPTANVSCDNSEKKITLTLTADFNAGLVELTISDNKITNPSNPGQYSLSIATRSAAQDSAIQDIGLIALAINNTIQITINVTDETPTTSTEEPASSGGSTSSGSGYIINYSDATQTTTVTDTPTTEDLETTTQTTEKLTQTIEEGIPDLQVAEIQTQEIAEYFPVDSIDQEIPSTDSPDTSLETKEPSEAESLHAASPKQATPAFIQKFTKSANIILITLAVIFSFFFFLFKKKKQKKEKRQ